jgi:ribonuclease T2
LKPFRPSDYTGDLGPFYCNRSNHFDPAALEPLEPTLSQRWPNLFVETEEDSLWKHEWLKHGTCAASIDQLGTQVKYFTVGIDFWQKFNLYEALKQAGITPSLSNSYQAHVIFNAIKAHFGANPLVQCQVFRTKSVSSLFYNLEMKERGSVLLSKIRFKNESQRYT